jgi:Tol biopolymer transport system component
VTRARGRLPVRACLALIVTGLATGAGDAKAAFPGENGRIAVLAEEFVWPPGPFDPRPPLDPDMLSSKVVTYSPTGRGPRVLHTLPAEEFLKYGRESGLSWSPNGKLLAFEEGGHLAVVRHDGTGVRRLRQLTWRDTEPAWSPTGRRLAFTGHDDCVIPTDCNVHLYRVRADGTGLHRIVERSAAVPAWSPTNTIAFRGGAANRLFEVRPDGSRLRRLFTPANQGSYDPDWSPDGSRLVFAAPANQLGIDQIFTVRADGTRLRRLTDPEGLGGTSPVWSPDGRYIAFIRNSDLYVMRSNGRGQRRIVDVGYNSATPNAPFTVLSHPAWQPRAPRPRSGS